MRRAKARVCDELPAAYGHTSALDAFGEDEVLARGTQILEARMLRKSGRCSCPDDFARFLSMKIGGCAREEFLGVWLDNKHRVIAVETLAHGTIDSAMVHSREVVRSAIKHNAAAVVFAHNHPSGDPTPSSADVSITVRLRHALGLIDVRLLDHFVVAGVEPPVSMEKSGWANLTRRKRRPSAPTKVVRRGASK